MTIVDRPNFAVEWDGSSSLCSYVPLQQRDEVIVAANALGIKIPMSTRRIEPESQPFHGKA